MSTDQLTVVRRGTERRECVVFSAFLADRVAGRLQGEELARIESHLATCRSCAATVRALCLIQRVNEETGPDLWPRLRGRLAKRHRTALVRLRPPPLTWDVAVALAAVVTVPWLAPEPVRFVAVVLGML